MYSVDGVPYESIAAYNIFLFSNYKKHIGKSVKIMYDPVNPNKISVIRWRTLRLVYTFIAFVLTIIFMAGWVIFG
ncbi:MAG: hypothetical protein FWG45_06920 [Oscillospiraceae bacterium]|nr:hypothetical protein [Oscillospiraceae bacterium]